MVVCFWALFVRNYVLSLTCFELKRFSDFSVFFLKAGLMRKLRCKDMLLREP